VRGKATLSSRKVGVYFTCGSNSMNFNLNSLVEIRVIEKLILFSISEDDKSVLLYPAKKIS